MPKEHRSLGSRLWATRNRNTILRKQGCVRGYTLDEEARAVSRFRNVYGVAGQRSPGAGRKGEKPAHGGQTAHTTFHAVAPAQHSTQLRGNHSESRGVI